MPPPPQKATKHLQPPRLPRPLTRPRRPCLSPYCQVLRALINRVPRMEPAAIHGYQRYRIKGQVFPGTIKAPAGVGAEAQVKGLVLFDLQPDELEVRAGQWWQ